MEKVLLHSITMPNYIRKIKLANARKAKFYIFPKDEDVKEKNKFNSNRYQWREHISSTKKKEIRLFDTATNEFVIKNTRTAGTEKWEVINSQKVYNGAYHPNVLGKIVVQIGQFISPFLEGLNPIDKYPLYIECEIHDYKDDPISGKRWDVINRGYLYCKVFDDILQPKTEKNPLGRGLVPDDTWEYIVCPSHPIFIPLKEEDKLLEIVPHLVFKIYHVI